MKKLLSKLGLPIFFLFLFVFLTFKLTSVPPGINFDESSIGYNAALISRTGNDELGNHLPVFFLTMDQKDWKRPVNIYFGAILFKILGVSYFNLRLISVIWIIIGAIFFYKLLRLFFNKYLSFIGLLIFLSSPSILIQSHLALENIAVLPFFIGWMYFLFSSEDNHQEFRLFLSGGLLGILIFAYKGMISMVPVYILISGVYLFWYGQKKSFIRQKIKNLAFFLLGLAPFILSLPIINNKYPEALFDPKTVHLQSYFDMLIVYLSSFDFSFLFGRGDSMLVHSTGRHGVFLPPTLILLILGLTTLGKNVRKEIIVIVAALVLTPAPLVLVNSVYRASRLLVFIPMFTFIFMLGLNKVLDFKRYKTKIIILLLLFSSLGWTYVDFVRYYCSNYSKKEGIENFSPDLNQAMNQLAFYAKKTNKNPYIEKGDWDYYRFDMNFFEQVYFPGGNLMIWPRDLDNFPQDAILLTGLSGEGNLKNLAIVDGQESGQKRFFIVVEK
jgi:4-amino-4-deoxy-L-arabinose transferase-like glycosyltransferase